MSENENEVYPVEKDEKLTDNEDNECEENVEDEVSEKEKGKMTIDEEETSIEEDEEAITISKHDLINLQTYRQDEELFWLHTALLHLASFAISEIWPIGRIKIQFWASTKK